jgi:hypothetical protein
MAYLRVEKPRFLFLEGSSGVEAATDVTTVTLADAPAARAASSVELLAPALGACFSAATAALGEGGAGSHLSGGACPLSLSSSSSSPDDE